MRDERDESCSISKLLNVSAPEGSWRDDWDVGREMDEVRVRVSLETRPPWISGIDYE